MKLVIINRAWSLLLKINFTNIFKAKYPGSMDFSKIKSLNNNSAFRYISL